MSDLVTRIGGSFELAADPGVSLRRPQPHAVESFSLNPSYRGLPCLRFNPTAMIAFDVGATLLARRPARPGFDPTRFAVLHNWSSIVTRQPVPSFVPLRTRLAWKLKPPPPFLDCHVVEPPAAAAARPEEPVRRALLPFFARFSSLAAVRDSLDADDGGTLGLARLTQLIEIDIALDDLDHLQRLRRRLTDPRQQDAVAAALRPFAQLDARWAT